MDKQVYDENALSVKLTRNGGYVMRCEIRFQWDAEEAVWIATSKDVPGLVLESGSFDALVERVKQVVPELLMLNGSVA